MVCLLVMVYKTLLMSVDFDWIDCAVGVALCALEIRVALGKSALSRGLQRFNYIADLSCPKAAFGELLAILSTRQ